MSHRSLTLLLLLMFAAIPALAQRVYWEPGAGSLAFNQASPLQLIFENCEPAGDPKLPSVDGLELLFTGSGSSFAMENMNVTRKHILNFSARPNKRPEVKIPAFDVDTDKGVKRVAAATYAIGNATVGQSVVPLESAVKSGVAPASGAFWAGEVFPVTYTLDIARRFRPRPPGPVVWKPALLTVEDWGQPEQFESTSGGEPRIGLIYKARGCIATPGSYTIPAASQEIVLVVDTSGNLFAFPFSAPEMVQHTVTSNEPELTINPLPDGAPADFGGAVGQFTFTSKIVPTTVTVGEPITWTLELGGSGNWPGIRGLPAREVSKDFKVLQPQAKRNPSAGKLFDATLSEDVVLIPTKPGTYSLGPVSYSFFDARSGTYKTLKTDRVTVTITPPGSTEPAAQSLVAPGARPQVSETQAPSQAAYVPHLPASPAVPAGIPRDPLLGATVAPVPLASMVFYVGLLCSVAWLVPIWLIFAAVRSRRTDPLRVRREARKRLGHTLGQLRHRSITPADRVQALHAWQRDSALLLSVGHAAPSPALLAVRARLPGHEGDGSAIGTAQFQTWAVLWSEADRALYGLDQTLPTDWVTRAKAALDVTNVPGWKSASLFHPRNLLPWFSANGSALAKSAAGKLTTITLLLFLLWCVRSAALAADASTPDTKPEPEEHFSSPLGAYFAGEFASAEKAWRKSIARTPSDWIARHNLALTLAQEGHWPEAAAHWTAAFLLNPRNESVRWHLALGYERAGYTPPGLGEFAQASGPHLVARLASPAEWQWLLLAGGVGLAIGILVILRGVYRGATNSQTRVLGLAIAGCAVLLMLAAATSLHLYGDTTDPRAAIAWHQVLLRSIPTEADTQQKTSSLPAGSLAVADKTFLGWVRLAFPNGQTGWVRQEDIVWLYR